MFGFLAILFATSGCGKSSKSSAIQDGQLHGMGISSGKYVTPKPFGMVYIPSGTFHMGPSDEDISYAFTARNKQVSINGFFIV